MSAQQAAQQAGVAESVRAFTAEMYGLLAARADEHPGSGPGNLVASPYSAATALGMTLEGARGETAAQIGRVLHVAPGGGSAFGSLGAEVAGAGETPAGVTLDLANSLWAQQDLGWKQDFLTALETGYKAAFQQVDFKTDAAATVDRINHWVAEQTKDKITELFRRGMLGEDARLVLVNAAYFKASWDQPFTDPTADRPFTLADGTTAKLPTMSETLRKVGVQDGPGWQALQLDFVGDRIAMALVLPDGPLADLEQSLSGAVIAELLKPYRTVGSLLVQLPKWSFRSRYELTEPLTRLGMPLAFDDRAADFSGMTADERLVIDTVVQEAYVAVDEQGAEAAAATGVGIVRAAALARPRELIFDRPFLFMVFDRQTRVPIFIGRVTDPRG